MEITVAMPTYNAEAFVREALDSILCQTFTQFDVLVVDDGSTDSTLSILRSYTDPRIKLIENSHNFTDTQNALLRLPTSKYIALMNDDDVCLPHRLQVQYDFMKSHPDAAVCAGGIRILGEAEAYLPPTELVRFESMLRCNQIANPTAMLRRSSLSKMKELYRPECLYAEDYDLWLRMCCKGMQLWTINSLLLLYRVHNDMASHTNAGQQCASAARARADIFSR
jgi:glycosyltransferase involved in cell wall biosynthesis